MKPSLYIVIPCYNEEEVLPVTSQLLLVKLDELMKKDKVSWESRILFVDDGSNDDTWKRITALAAKEQRIFGIRLSRNFGHQYALLAGLMRAKEACDICISMDCDGQDDVEAMNQMVEEYLTGSEIVYGIRSRRDSDSFVKRFTAEGFYHLLKGLGAKIIYNHADYRLMSKKALRILSEFSEENLYLRGIIPMIGLKSSSVAYERSERMAGKSHYSVGKMISLAMSGVTSLSIRPIRLIEGIGLLSAFVGFLGILWSIIQFVTGSTVSGWSSMICAICFMGGVQMLCLGVIGEYIGKIYLETKRRPLYIIEEET